MSKRQYRKVSTGGLAITAEEAIASGVTSSSSSSSSRGLVSWA
jgi:hypothetical protein